MSECRLTDTHASSSGAQACCTHLGVELKLKHFMQAKLGPKLTQMKALEQKQELLAKGLTQYADNDPERIELLSELSSIKQCKAGIAIIYLKQKQTGLALYADNDPTSARC